MRNLKKILALVLALVMSLSLMATASAKQDFTDASSIDEKYATAVEVLNGLEVFKGYQNGSSYDFQPNGEITRAEVAAIIYRIATGDVKDDQVKIYADYNKFTDVPSTLWSAGYINYCANAEYIKGEGNGKFNPEGKVTGYQALAMILRAIGYTANGGFTGPGWDLQTAAVGEARGITKNILKGTLNENATRQTVAEILFQAILVNMVNFDQRTGYYELGESLGYKIFKLEEIEGVVVANEYANLNGNSVLKEGKTKLETKDDIRDLDVGSELTDIGESRAVYVTGKTVLSSLTDTGKNVVWDSADNAGASITSKKAIEKVGRAVVGTTEYYKNFAQVGYYLSDSRIEYEIFLALTLDEAKVYADAKDGNGGTLYIQWEDEANKVQAPAKDVNGKRIQHNGVDTYLYYYNKAIPVGQKITQLDYDNIQDIFYRSNGLNFSEHDNTTDGRNRLGRVYVRTQTAKDISDEITHKEFVETYINNTAWDITWDKSQNGEWVKIVDYNGDGTVDYAFLTEYWLDEVIGTYTKSGENHLQYNALDELTDNYDIRYLATDLAVGDVVIYSLIDGQALVERAESLEGDVTTVNYTKDTITLSDGTEKGQSGIHNDTDMQQIIENMDHTKYVMYLDKYGYVRAYKLPGGNQYGLLTELYATNNNVGNLVQNWPMTVELTNSENVTDEYSVSNANSNPFVAVAPWTLITSPVGTYNFNNWLQPAVAHLGASEQVRRTPDFSGATSYLTFWNKNNQLIKTWRVGGAGLNGSGEFDYDQQNYYNLPLTSPKTTTSQDPTVSFTNVARYSVSGDKSVNLYSATEYLRDKSGNIVYRDAARTNPVFAVDYVQLSTKDVEKGARHYTIHDNYAGRATSNAYVDATHDTQYFIVFNGGVFAFTDYANMPALTNAKYNIHAAYAVATNTISDYAGKDYWVADVIVYEVETWDNAKNTSIALGYWNGMKSVASASGIRYLDSLDNKAEGTQVTIRPSNSVWAGAQWGENGLGFYKVFDGSEVANGEMTASRIEKITADFNDNSVFAGYITRQKTIVDQGGYYDVCKSYTGTNKDVSVAVDVAPVFSVTNNSAGVTLSEDLVRSTTVKADDDLIWVMNGDAVAYIVDLGNPVTNKDIWDNTPRWLHDIHDTIMAEQATYDAVGTYTLTVKADKTGLPTEIANLIPNTSSFTLGVGQTATIVTANWAGDVSGTDEQKALAAALTAYGYAFSGFVQDAKNPTGLTGPVASGNDYTFTGGAKESYVVLAKYAGVNQTLTNSTGAAMDVKVNGAAAVSVANSSAQTIQTGAAVVATLTNSLGNYDSLEIEVINVGKNAPVEFTRSGKEISFTMPDGDVKVKATVKTAQYTVAVAAGNNIVLENGSDVTSFKTNCGVVSGSITVKPAAGYQFTTGGAVAKLNGKVITTGTWNVGSSDYTIKITSTDIGPDAVVEIEAATELISTKPVVTFTIKTYQGQVSVSETADGTFAEVATGGTITLPVGGSIYIKLSNATGTNITTNTTDKVLGPDANGLYYVENITGDVTITVTGNATP